MTLAGVYLHIPFCHSRCSYCDFATGMYEGGLAERYVRALVREIETWAEVESPQAIDTIYFGGGTPSLLAPAQIEQILKAVHLRFAVLDGAEVTIELNPGSLPSPQPQTAQRNAKAGPAENESPELTNSKLREFYRLGINRVSFGAQTFDDRELKQLGRTHTAAEIPSTFDALRAAGFRNLNFDLIAGLPGQTLTGWQRNLDAALKLAPEHLSLYLLDVHEGTPLADQIMRGMRPQPDDDLTAEMYRLMIDQVTAAGYEHYEISNFCRPGFESRHNTKYWTGAAYYGFGCSAHSYDGVRRRWSNERDAAKYSQAIEDNQTSICERIELKEEDARSESIFLGLRLMRGLDLESYRSRFGSSLRDEYASDLARLRDAGLVEIDREVLKLTKRGALLSNEVFAALA